MTPGTLLLYTAAVPNHPGRPAAWRWALAQECRDSPRANRLRPVDPLVAKAAALQAAVAESTNDRQRVAALTEAGPLGEAYLFWTGGVLAAVEEPRPDAPPPPLQPQALAKAELEAYVLAGKGPEKIGRWVGMSPEAVRAYEDVWFDVRDRRRNPGWVAANVVGNLQVQSPQVLLPNLLRAYGYYTRSARVVRIVAGGFDPAVCKTAAKDPTRFFAADAASAAGVKAALAVRMMPLGVKTYARVVELHHEALDLEVRGKELGGNDAEVRYREATEFLRKLEFRYGESPMDDSAELPASSRPALPRLRAAGGDDD